MKQFIVIALLAIVVTTTYGDDSNESGSIDSNESGSGDSNESGSIESKTPAYPPSCCSSRLGCSASDLAPYCPACVSTCARFVGCPCTFPGTDEVISPRPAPPPVPRAPFCPQCGPFLCPFIRIVCLDPSNYTCTAEQIQGWINSN